ncbi:MAG: TIGR02452 family protein [Coprobacillus sp.]|nr:TIGR02452 family protein [Coprobacillus sp.]
MPELTKAQKQMLEEMRRKQNEGLSEQEIKRREEYREMRKNHNIEMLSETLSICSDGKYTKEGKTISLGISKKEMETAVVFLPEDLKLLSPLKSENSPNCVYSCENKDCLVLAKEELDKNPGSDVLVLNLAGYKRPGGGSRDGGTGQEEDLTRRSSLLVSLDSDRARKYYDYNNRLGSDLGSDGIILSPKVVVFRDNKEELLDEPYNIAILSCAAPMVRLGYSGLSEPEYEDMLLGRIKGILKVASIYGYKHLVLGAFGCGVYGNDAKVVSKLFKIALSDKSLNTFESVSFAVLCKDEDTDYNFTEFNANFGE